MRAAVALLALLASCTDPPPSRAPDVPATASQGASAPPGAAASSVRGTLAREASVLTLDGKRLHFAAKRCREPQENAIGVEVSLYPEDSPLHVDDILLRISADPAKVRAGEKIEPHLRASPGFAAHARVIAHGFVSLDGRIAQAQWPESGWIRFDAISRNGPVDVSFALAFDAKSRIEGRVRLAETEEVVCVIPAPPPPPPPPPPPR